MAKVTEEQKNRINKAVEYFLNNPGISYAKVAKMFDISETTIPRRLKKMGYNIDNYNSKKIKHNLIEEAFDYYLNHPDETYKSVADKFNIHRQSMESIIKEKGYEFKELRRNKYEINSTFFDYIETEETAYWLGFFLADGCIKKNNQIQLALSYNDYNHVLKFKTALNSQHEIVKESNSNLKKTSVAAVLRFHDIHMKESLNKLGIENNKTCKEIPYKDISNELIRHYIRGIVDGDGWFSYTKSSNSYEFGIGMGYDVLEWIEKQIHEILNIKHKEIKPYKSDNFYRLRYFGKDARKILIWLYEDSTVYLDRKYIKFKSLPFQNEIDNNSEIISAELSGKTVKSQDTQPEPKADSDISQGQRVDSDPSTDDRRV